MTSTETPVSCPPSAVRVPLCGNDEHLNVGPYRPPAIVNVTWPDGQWRPALACKECLTEILAVYTDAVSTGTVAAMTIEPVRTGKDR